MRALLLKAAVLTTLLVGCGDDSGVAPDTGAPTDAAADGDGDAADTAMPPVECDFPAPMIAGTPETDAVADAPARCGQGAFAWLDDAAIGTLTGTGELNAYEPSLLAALLEGTGTVLPRMPEEPVVVKQIRYLTQDRGAMVETTAAVAYPSRREPGDAIDVLLFLHGTSGLTNGCGPSSDASRLVASLLASFGYVVVMPDYFGLEWGDASYGALHPYLVGQATAIASIDAVRAIARADATERGGVCIRPRVVTFGGSQGGHAALWVERLMPYYARELEHLGVVATVPPADLLREGELGLGTARPSSANMAAMFTAMPAWYGAGDRLDEVFVPPYDTSLTEAAVAECVPDAFDGLTEITDLFTMPLVDAAQRGELASVDPWGCMVSENGLTTTSIPRITEDTPSFGVLFVLGESDTLLDAPTERAAYQTLCEAGMPLTYLECAAASHTQATAWSLPTIVDFIDARAAGDAFTADTSCAAAAPTRCPATP